ncbi:MAG: hypothetical protein WBO36_14605, partial [Saprospiraceae bacterium]
MKRFLFLLIGLWTLIPLSDVRSQSMACYDHINLSVSEVANSCEATINHSSFMWPLVGSVIYIRESSASNARYLTAAGTWSAAPVNLLGVTVTGLSNLVASKKNYIFEVVNPGVNNRCWGTVLFEDKAPPVPAITCPSSITIQCYEVAGYLLTTGATAVPAFTDNCSAVTTTITSIVNNVADCGGSITRTFVASDASGNT